MTMPHLMNCIHSDSGWCLACVKQLNDEKERLLSLIIKKWSDGGFVVNFANIVEHGAVESDGIFGHPIMNWFYFENLDRAMESVMGQLRYIVLQDEVSPGHYDL